MPCSTTTATTDRHKPHGFPAEIISYSMGLYLRCCLRYYDSEALRCARGIIDTYEASRQW
jgi:transposase-like protein